MDEEKIALPENVYKYQTFGGRDIKFSMQEASRLPVIREPGIKLLGFKPQSKLDVSLHLEAPKFITYNETELEGMHQHLVLDEWNVRSSATIL